ncbi:unnamed protein product [Linum trigynum]|uniref:Uncharacterized protein n=1 Tax=Linum trigynum TaxID=586398 RepID=A0AAV2EH26_9ROSI
MKERGTDLKLRRFHGDGNADEEDADHGDGSVAAPVLWAAIRATGHAPHLPPEIAMSAFSSVPVLASSAHLSDNTTQSISASLTRSSSSVFELGHENWIPMAEMVFPVIEKNLFSKEGHACLVPVLSGLRRASFVQPVPYFGPERPNSCGLLGKTNSSTIVRTTTAF